MSSDFTRLSDASRRPLPVSFFQREPHALARELLGRDLVRVLDDGTRLSGRIIEVEVYGYEHDPASHANSGAPTERTAPMFGRPGTAYVYQIYGMYHCLNVVAPAHERPAALLVRALHPLEGLDPMAEARGLAGRYEQAMPASVRKNLLSGPGKICQAMGIDGGFNEHPLDHGALHLTEGICAVDLDAVDIARGPRVGLNPKTVGEASEWPWRYGIRGSKYLSRPFGR